MRYGYYFIKSRFIGNKTSTFAPYSYNITLKNFFTEFIRINFKYYSITVAEIVFGKANTDMYLKMAKDFLEDKDAGVKFGEKLAAYYDNIVNV